MALTTATIKKFIAEDMASERKRAAEVGERYYHGDHDILHSRMFYFSSDGKLVEDTTRANIKIAHPFFMLLADQFSAYVLSTKNNPIQAKKKDDGLQDLLDERFDDSFWAEIGELVTGTYVKGFEYLYRYKDKDNRTVYQCADSIGVVEVSARDADDRQDHIIYHYTDTMHKGKQTVRRIQDWTATEVHFYVQIGDGKIEADATEQINPRPHVVYADEKTGKKTGKPFGYIPFRRLDYCKKQHSGLKAIKGLIDDYDLHACSLSNTLVDFDTPLYVVRGYQGHTEEDLERLGHNLKTKKTVSVDSDGGVDVQTVNVPYEARKEKLTIDKEGIYTFGMGFDPTQVGDGNITNVVILSRYTLLDLKKSKFESRLIALLRDIVKTELEEINAENGTAYKLSDIDIALEPDIPTNEAENLQNEKLKAETQQIRINTILNAATNIGDETALQAICDILELDYAEVQRQIKAAQDEADTASVRALLGGVVTNERTAADSAGAISR